MIRIADAINLHNERLRVKNIDTGKPQKTNFLTKSNLGRILFPSRIPKKPLQMLLLMEKQKRVEPETLKKACSACGVDPNFMLGFPSVHDKDFNKLVCYE